MMGAPIRTIDEMRKKRGLEPLPEGAGAQMALPEGSQPAVEASTLSEMKDRIAALEEMVSGSNDD